MATRGNATDRVQGEFRRVTTTTSGGRSGVPVPDRCLDEIADLLEELTPQISHRQAANLLAALVRAQMDPPEDKRAFVEQVNRLLDLCRIRISTRTGEIYRLKYLRAHNGYVYLQDSKDQLVPFREQRLCLVDAARGYRNNRFYSDHATEAPVIAGPEVA